MANTMDTKSCVCNKCGAKAHSMPGTQHRRCSGNPENATLMEKYCSIPPAQRGEWQPAS